MTDQPDWRLTNQRQWITNQTLTWKPYTASPNSDHEHCAFCWDKFMERGANETLSEGWVTDDQRHWICDPCCQDFKDSLEFETRPRER